MSSDVPDVPNQDNASARNEVQSNLKGNTTSLLDAIDLFQRSRDYLLARGVKLDKQIPRGDRKDIILNTGFPRWLQPILFETLDLYNYVQYNPNDKLVLCPVERSDNQVYPTKSEIAIIRVDSLPAQLFSEKFSIRRHIEDPELDSMYSIRVKSTNDIIFAGIGLAIIDMIKTWTTPCSDFDFMSRIDRFPKDENLSETWISRYKEPIFKRHKGKVLVSGKGQDISITKIVFPYLKLGSIGNNKRKRTKVGKAMECFPFEGKAHFNGYNSIHVTHTLDEAYYPGLSPENLAKRNEDQVVTRYFRNDSTRTLKPILMVPQVWLWQLGKVLLSAYVEIGNLEVPPATTSPERYMGQVMGEKIRDFGFGPNNAEDDDGAPQTLSIFENALVTCLAEVDEYVRSEDHNISMEAMEYKFIHEVSDIRDELAMILEVLSQQMSIVDDLLQVLDMRREHCPELEEGKKLVEKYTKRANKMDKDAERIERGIQDRLNLRRTAASINEAQASVREARDAKLLSLSAVGFTIITFIFTPLSFIATLLALDIDWFSNIKHSTNATEIDGSGSDVYSGKKVVGIFIGTEIIAVLLTIILGCLVAFLFFRFTDAPDSKPSLVSALMGKLHKRRENVSNPERASGKDETTGQERSRKQTQCNAPASDTDRNQPGSSGGMLQRLRGKVTGEKISSPA